MNSSGAQETVPATVHQKDVAKKAIFKPNKSHKNKNERNSEIHLKNKTQSHEA